MHLPWSTQVMLDATEQKMEFDVQLQKATVDATEMKALADKVDTMQAKGGGGG